MAGWDGHASADAGLRIIYDTILKYCATIRKLTSTRIPGYYTTKLDPKVVAGNRSDLFPNDWKKVSSIGGICLN